MRPGHEQSVSKQDNGATHNPLSHVSTEALSRASTEGLLLELRRRIVAPRDRRHETWDDWGDLDPQGDWPEEG